VGNKKNNIIEINGKRYDASTGALLDGASSVKIEHSGRDAASVIKPVVASVGSIPVQHHTPHPPKPTPHGAGRQRAKSAKSHSPEHSKTLMRHTVKKPAPGLKRRIKAHGHTDSLAKKPSVALSPKLSARNVDPKKLSHASHVPKSHHVKRFSKTQPAGITIPVAVKKIAPKPALHKAPAQHVATAPGHRQTTADLLNHALRQATSHQQPPPKKIARKRRGPSRRATSITALACALVLLGGFVAFSNLTNVKLKVASAKAGFTANLPEQQPAGYHLSHLNYSPGVVALHFHSNSDSRSFAITEKASAWDSGTLRDTYVASSGQRYQTVESGGRTLYLLGQNTATWVNGGVWYHVQANGSLSSRQLVALATSM
jgi:hypothetical protein